MPCVFHIRAIRHQFATQQVPEIEVVSSMEIFKIELCNGEQMCKG